MSCTGCGSSYGFLKKEVGCETCGFSFCAKCCPKRTITKGDVKFQQLSCNKCYESLNSKKIQLASYSPPSAHKKRMAALANRSYSVGSTGAGKEGNEKDKEIAERLQRLKRERNKERLPSQLEIEERLAKLKGMDPAKYTAPPIMVYRPSDRRSSADQASDLIKQMEGEVHLEAESDRAVDEIAARLAILRGESVPLASSSSAEVTGIPKQHEITRDVDEHMDIDDEHKKMRTLYEESLGEAKEEISNLAKDSDIKKVLENIKSESMKGDPDADALDEDAEADLVIEQLLAANLASDMEDPESLTDVHIQSPDVESKGSTNTEDEEEFPWCVICTENARIRCFGCDGDLYCMRCFKECHDSLDIVDHKTCPFLCPKA